jgi:hypothetical protein
VGVPRKENEGNQMHAELWIVTKFKEVNLNETRIFNRRIFILFEEALGAYTYAG